MTFPSCAGSPHNLSSFHNRPSSKTLFEKGQRTWNPDIVPVYFVTLQYQENLNTVEQRKVPEAQRPATISPLCFPDSYSAAKKPPHGGDVGPIYLDYAATTPVEPAVIETMLQYLGPDTTFGNPASETHLHGIEAKYAVEIARQQVANLLGAHPDEIVWTSGATEATNLAIKGTVQQVQTSHVVTASTEHKATLDTCGYLEESGIPITYVSPDSNG